MKAAGVLCVGRCTKPRGPRSLVGHTCEECWLTNPFGVATAWQGTPAETLLYQVKSDAYEWTPCRVVGWDCASRTFEVRFDSPEEEAAAVASAPEGACKGSGAGRAGSASGLRSKHVKRLNLRFKVGLAMQIKVPGGAALGFAARPHGTCLIGFLSAWQHVWKQQRDAGQCLLGKIQVD